MRQAAPHRPHVNEQEPVLRQARLSDVPAIIDIDSRNTGLAKPDYWQDMFERFGDRAGRFFLVAEGEGRVLAFIIGEVRAWEFGSPPCGWIFAIGVDSDTRMKRLGSRMFDAIMDRFRDTNVDKVRTMVAVDDHLLMSFFRSQGMMAGPSLQLEIPLDWKDQATEGGA